MRRTSHHIEPLNTLAPETAEGLTGFEVRQRLLRGQLVQESHGASTKVSASQIRHATVIHLKNECMNLPGPDLKPENVP
jgi:hypothetical protein